MAQKAHRRLARARAALGALVAALALATGAPAEAASGKGPEWAALTADQQQVLAPLREDWNALTPEQKRKWLGIAQRYPAMSAEEQQRVQRRMEKWARLSTEERWKARQQYRNLEKIAPERREELRRYWAEYQSLSPEERRMFDVPPVETRAEARKRRASPAKAPASRPYIVPSYP
ncbi:MAG: DUF3106 domain-containing protein [Burkholderiales bacterium]|nr:DUF3106 domain-containing protein [Burkholderiales bacterium]